MTTTLDLTVRVVAPWVRPAADLVDAFRKYPVANIGDAMDRLGLCDGGIASMWAGARFVGTALPILTTSGDNAAVIKALELIEPGDVVVVNGFGHTHRALVGDQLAQRFAAAGAVGAVIDGAIRDQAHIAELRYPVFARGANPAGPFKNGPGVIGEAVAVGGIVCAAGDIVAADADGVIVIPAQRAEEILGRVEAVAEHEAVLTAAVTRPY